VHTVRLDLADAASVRAAAAELDSDFARIDLLINNAGAAFGRRTLVDGVERTFATNQLGPFAFTGLLLRRVLAAPAGRIVTVTSGGYELGRLHLDDLGFAKRRFGRWRAYTQTKLANLLFARELQRRLAAAGAAAISVAAHPGAAATEFGRNSGGVTRWASASPVRWLFAPLVNTAAEGALPTLRAAVDPRAGGGELYGPGGPHGVKGPPERVEVAAVARDEAAGVRLWERCEQLTGVRYPLP
jgi:NAD(P)-dependent dehydrogenase (short-subunit alcohol dehydrogenase family)